MRCRSWRTLVGAAITLVMPNIGMAEDHIRVYGWDLPAWQGGGFRPAGTELAYMALDNGSCWDGQRWHRLYPEGPRTYARATGRVACRIIDIDQPSCWDGSEWYRLPSGTLYGVIAGIISPTPGAFITTPLPP